MTSEEEVERQIRKALMVRAARVHLRTDEWIEPVAPPSMRRREAESRHWLRRSWELALLPAIAALVAAIVVLGSGHVPASQRAGEPSSAGPVGIVARPAVTPPGRSAAGGVVLAGEGRVQPPAEGSRGVAGTTRACDLGIASALVHGLRSPNCLQ